MFENLLSVSKTWREDLPESHRWTEKVSLNASTGSCAGHTNVVPVHIENGQTKLFGSISQAESTELTAQISKSGWKGQSGSLRATVADRNFVLIPKSTLKVEATQVGRQLGLDAAAALKDFANAPVNLLTDSAFCAASMLEGFLAGQYSAGIFKSKQATTFVDSVSLSASGVDAKQLEQVRTTALASSLMRFLQDAPANWLNPPRFAEIAKDLAKELNMKCTVLGPEEMKAQKMGAFLSVAKAAASPAQLIVLEIKGQDSSKTVALVGKGLTFDSGGNSIKPSAGMEEMKYDMSGGAAVLAAAMVLAKNPPKHNVVCLIGAVENLVSGDSTRPGDIVRAMNGKTIEVINTDAEGRLVLVDVLHYAITNYKPGLVVDVATLTGAVIIGLGHFGAGIMGNDSSAVELVRNSAKAVGEPVWELPLWPESAGEVKSDFADYANITSPSVKAGSIMGGAFIKEFVGETPWVHVDVAGTAWSCSATGFPKKGGSGFALRTLVETARRFGNV
jgi:leucyl aminopeptidase